MSALTDLLAGSARRHGAPLELVAAPLLQEGADALAHHLADRWVWDFWLAHDGAAHHAFYLQAPRSLGDPDLRHWNVSVGHAVSHDLRSWSVLPDALAPGPPAAWDDFTTWTGGVVRTDDRWAMLYTGASRREEGLVQRIGLAWSDDLVTWHKDDANPVMEADRRWYERLDAGVWHDEAWRDPTVVRDPVTGVYHAFLTARVGQGDPATRGVLARATSPDLRTWTVHEPVVGPRGFGYLEVPQVVHTAGRWHLLVSVDLERQTGRPPPHDLGTFHATADALVGPYRETGPLFVDARARFYGGKLVAHDGGLVCLAWRNLGEDGTFVGAISDPWPVTVEAEGVLRVHPDAPGVGG